jgi:hypothetical protein
VGVGMGVSSPNPGRALTQLQGGRWLALAQKAWTRPCLHTRWAWTRPRQTPRWARPRPPWVRAHLGCGRERIHAQLGVGAHSHAHSQVGSGRVHAKPQGEHVGVHAHPQVGLDASAPNNIC